MTINRQTILIAAMLAVLIQPLHASMQPLRATMTGGRGPNGRCSIEVIVDGSAEVEISGDMGQLRTLTGQFATWRKFQCSGPLPRNPGDFSFARIDGRGNIRLVRDPRSNGGTAVIRIDDPQGGRDRYAIDVQWREYGGGGWGPGPQEPPRPTPGRGPGGFPMARAIQICQDSVSDRLHRDGYRGVSFERVYPDNNPGRNDWVLGSVTAKRGFDNARFSFSCSVDFRSGTVRRVDVQRR